MTTPQTPSPPHPTYPYDAPPQQRPRNGLGTAALVVGIVAAVVAFIPWVGVFAAIPAGLLAAVFGAIGIVRAARRTATNKGSAIAGTALGGAAIVIAIAVTAVFAGDGEFDTRGSIEVPSSDAAYMEWEAYGEVDAGRCVVGLGFGDVETGSEVAVTSADGTLVANGALRAPKWSKDGDCLFPFQLNSVPSGQEFYRVEVGDRGQVALSEDQMRVLGPQLILGN